MNLPTQMALTKAPVRTANPNGGQVQTAPNRQPMSPPPVQMVAQNRQPTQNQMPSVPSQLQYFGQVQVTKKNRKEFLMVYFILWTFSWTVDCPFHSFENFEIAAPSQPNLTAISAAQAVPQFPGLTISTVQRNNQQRQLLQQQQQPISRAGQGQPALTITSLPPKGNANIANSVALAVDANGLNDPEMDGIDDLATDMDIDETIGNGKANDKEADFQEPVSGASEHMSKPTNATENDDGLGDTVNENNGDAQLMKTKNDGPIDEDGEFRGFNENDVQGDGYDSFDEDDTGKAIPEFEDKISFCRSIFIFCNPFRLHVT